MEIFEKCCLRARSFFFISEREPYKKKLENPGVNKNEIFCNQKSQNCHFEVKKYNKS